MTDPERPAAPAKTAGNWPLIIDYGPLIIFFLAYKMLGVFVGTAVFMVTMIAALILSRIKLGRIAPMLWLSAILIFGFGALTIWFHDQRFIQMKPTIIYAMLAAVLIGGLMLGKPVLKYVLEVGYDGLSERGWTILTRNWAGFFVAMAVLNEVLRHTLDFDHWLTVKVWGLPILSILFAIANVPFLMKHGLGAEPTPTPPPAPDQPA